MLLQEGLEVTNRDFFNETLSESEVRHLAAMVGTENIFARRSPSLKKLGLADKELSDDEMVSLMLQEPNWCAGPCLEWAIN